jgi:hypothetical protein
MTALNCESANHEDKTDSHQMNHPAPKNCREEGTEIDLSDEHPRNVFDSIL